MKRAVPLIATLLIFIACDATDTADDTAGTPAESVEVVAHMPTEAESADILAVLQEFFDGLAGDPELIANAVEPNIVMQSTDARGGTVVFGSSTASFNDLRYRRSTKLCKRRLERFETSEVLMTERMWDPEVRVAGALATVWTPYDFYVGSEFSHCGIDVATLMRRDGGWKIINLNWTRQVPPGCALHPDGPPND